MMAVWVVSYKCLVHLFMFAILSLYCFSETKFFKVELGFRLKPGDSVDVTTEEVFVHAMTPFPTKISQSEKQYVVFSGNHYYYSPYTVKKQTTTVSLATSSVESHTKLKPSSLSDNAVTYGPYSDVEAYSADPMRVHFENSTPFLSVSCCACSFHYFFLKKIKTPWDEIHVLLLISLNSTKLILVLFSLAQF